MNPPAKINWTWLRLFLIALLAGCGASNQQDAGGVPSASSGQVANLASQVKLTAYSAARVAEQASFGATPALLADLTSRGPAGWLDSQMALPASQIESPSWVIDYNDQDRAANERNEQWKARMLVSLPLTAPDQLRLRVSWALLQFVPANKTNPYGQVEYYNLLQRHALGNYAQFLKEMTIHPVMGTFLDNVQNRPKSEQCPGCAPNENYARELLQLFSVGVVQLNADGTTVRDAKGKPKETYVQDDVEELARALTGWRFAPSNILLGPNWINAGKPMVPEESSAAHDQGAKRVMGTDIPAGQDAPKDLDSVIAMIMKHPNVAPFVSLRLIQHLVTSNPTPQYIGRVAAVFQNNGQGVAGDMKAVVRAVLLDAEARRGDVIGADTSRFGKLREPWLWFIAVQRGLGCSRPLEWSNGWISGPRTQMPFTAPSVFSFYLPTDRAPGSNLLAPEQKLLNTVELTARLNQFEGALRDASVSTAAGCDVAALGQMFTDSPKTYVDALSTRFFRAAMPPTLRSNLMELASTLPNWGWSSPAERGVEGAVVLLHYALTSPYFGVIK